MEVINVSKHYGHSIILKDINFALNKGEIVGLVGRNGVGKSTLMKILVQNNQPTSGNIISSDNVGYLIEEPKLFLSNTQSFSKSNLVHCLLTVDFKTLFSSP
ncbi:ATP-binding cassette domain-containing protein [Streptococcus pseudopneumoniae]|uniref:ATP-binding cassette domain-containing protein n=1 Tax=Streptococcus pseudopneumoniae TaxID=257758 RepID=UPI003D2C6FCC